MTTHDLNDSRPRRILGPWRMAGLVVVLVWTAVCHARWWRVEEWGLHALPALTLGLIALTLIDGAVAFVRGASKPWNRLWPWLGRRGTWLGGLWRVAFLITVVVLFYSVESWRGHRAWAGVTRDFRARGDDVNRRFASELPADSGPNLADLPMFEPLLKELRRRIETVEDVLQPDYGALAPIHRWDLSRRPFGLGSKKPMVASWMTQENTDFRAWLKTWPSAGPAMEPTVQVEVTRTNGVKLRSVPDRPAVEIPKDATPAEAAAAVLDRMQEFEPMLSALAAAGDRRICRFPLDYERQMWRDNPALAVLNGFAGQLRLRASARLAVGRHDEAFADIQLLLRILDYSRQQPWAIMGTHRLWVALDAVQPIWEGLRSRRWTEEQLSTLQAQLSALDLLGDMPATLRNDAFAMADVIESFVPVNAGRGGVPVMSRRDEEMDAWLQFMRWVYPTGWSLQDQSAFLRVHLEVTSRVLDDTNRTIGAVRARSSDFARNSSDPLFAVFIVPKAEQMFQDAWQLYPAAQTAIDLATVACALERARNSLGAYPETLAGLVPRWMTAVPRDIVSGAPLRFRREGEGYRLYSVGLDQQDGDGRPGTWEESRFPVLTDGDWVWAPHPQSR